MTIHAAGVVRRTSVQALHAPDNLPVKKPLLGNLILVFLSTTITLLIAEAGLRLLAPNLASEPVTSNQYNFYRYDPVLGWSNIPDARGTFSRAEFSYELNINGLGLRGAAITTEKPAGTRRIAVLGDSFVWGIGAAEPELFTTLLADAMPATQVLNFGVAGYSPIQYHLLTDKVLALDPDLVIISFCLGNDFADAVYWNRYDYYKPYARLDESGQLLIDGYPIPDIKRFPGRYDSGPFAWLHEHSWLVRLVARFTRGLGGGLGRYGQKGPEGFEEADIYLQPDKPSTGRVMQINARLLERISAAYQARGIPVIVLAAPTKCELGQCYTLEKRSDAARRLLKRAVTGLPVTLVDPADGFDSKDFWSKDAHWNASGHRKIAEALLPAVANALAGSPGPGPQAQ